MVGEMLAAGECGGLGDRKIKEAGRERLGGFSTRHWTVLLSVQLQPPSLQALQTGAGVLLPPHPPGTSEATTLHSYWILMSWRASH